MKVKIEIPQSLNSITLGQYQEFQKILKANEGQEESTFVQIKMLQIFCNVDKEALSKLPLEIFDETLAELSEVLNEKPRHRLRVKLNDKEFGFIPKLDDITLGEYVDLETYISDPLNYHKALAVLYRPITMKVRDTYTIEDYKASQEHESLMKEMGLADALGAIVFFYRLGEELARHTIASLEEDMMEAILNERNLGKDGDGISQLITLQEEMSQELTKLQNFHYINVYLN
jgi:hypothetical protein